MSDINVSKIKPLQDRVLVKRQEKQTTSAGGIIFTSSSNEDAQQCGHVVAVGEGKRSNDGTTHPINLNVGSLVYFAKYSGVEFKFDNEEYIVMKEEDIVAVSE